MANVIVFKNKDGSEVAFEVIEPKQNLRSGTRPVTGAAPKAAQRTTEELTKALDGVPGILTAVKEKLSGLGVEELEASIGLKMTGEAKFIVAAASAEASLTIKLKIKPG